MFDREGCSKSPKEQTHGMLEQRKESLVFICVSDVTKTNYYTSKKCSTAEKNINNILSVGRIPVSCAEGPRLNSEKTTFSVANAPMFVSSGDFVKGR